MLQRLAQHHHTRSLISLRPPISAGAPGLRPVARPQSIRMATSDTQLDKNTPDSKWKEILTPEEYAVLRGKGTERAGVGEYNKLYDEGVYVCRACGNPLYTSETKFNSGCGWPAYYDHIPGAVERIEDNAYGMKRVEIVCAKCHGHLGHVFEGEGFPTPTNERHCVNSISTRFIKAQK